MTSEQAGALALFGLVGVGVAVLVGIVLYVLVVVAYWKMFTKAGEKGWKSIIPIYNLYIAYKLAWKSSSAFWVFLIAEIVASIAISASGTIAAVAITIITCIAGIIALIWHIRFCLKQAKAYNKGTGCGILALFFPNIMTLYYGFASTATYQGPQD